MKKMIMKGLACLLAFALMMPMVVQYTAPSVAEAARKEKKVEIRKEINEVSKKKGNVVKTNSKKEKQAKKVKKEKKASFAVTKKTLNGIGIAYQIEVKNLAATTARTWYSTNDKVAKVDSNGLVTSVNNGTAVIKCVVGDKKKGVRVLSCVVKVQGTKASVSIINKQLEDKVQYMTVGSSYDFDAVIKPEGTAGKVFWSVSDPTVATVNTDGVVTALKEGLTVLTVAAVNDSAAVTSGSANTLPTVKNDQVVIKVTSGAAIEAAKVQDVALANDKTLVIKFGTPMKADTLFNSVTSVLVDSIIITPVTNANGITAINPGELKGVLAGDGKTLTITAANYFYGYYDIKLTNQAAAASGALLQNYQKRALLIYLQ